MKILATLSGGVLETEINSLPKNEKNSWLDVLRDVTNHDLNKYIALDKTLTELYNTTDVNPKRGNMLRAFKECSFDNVRVVLCGQDPYPNPAHAVGLSFSIPAGAPQAQSLKNILTELKDDIGETQVLDGDLSPWAKQGVLLLNTSLTVEAGKPNSHKDLWADFGVNVLRELNMRQNKPLVFILWGSMAHKIGKEMEKTAPEGAPRKFIYSVHPSPLSAYRGFFGSKPFSQTNDFLVANNEPPIIW